MLRTMLNLCTLPIIFKYEIEMEKLTYESAREEPKSAPGIGAEIVVKTNHT